MTRSATLLMMCFLSTQSLAQFVIKAEGIKPDNACQPEAIYFLAENKAKPKEKIDSIESKLNRTVTFVKQNPTFNGKPSIQFVVNCRGELGGGFHVVTKSGNETLDHALLDFFKSINKWEAGLLEKKPVDSWYMWKLEIRNGRMVIIGR